MLRVGNRWTNTSVNFEVTYFKGIDYRQTHFQTHTFLEHLQQIFQRNRFTLDKKIQIQENHTIILKTYKTIYHLTHLLKVVYCKPFSN